MTAFFTGSLRDSPIDGLDLHQVQTLTQFAFDTCMQSFARDILGKVSQVSKSDRVLLRTESTRSFSDASQAPLPGHTRSYPAPQKPEVKGSKGIDL